MTAKELIAILNTVDPEARVIIPAYDHRKSDICAIVQMDINKEDQDNTYDIAMDYIEADAYPEKPPLEKNAVSLQFYATYWQHPKAVYAESVKPSTLTRRTTS